MITHLMITRPVHLRRLWCLTIASTLLSVTAARCGAAEVVSFEHDVAPILTQHCLHCHNDRDHRGGLSLQTAEAFQRGGDSGQVVTAGEPDNSYLLDLVVTGDSPAEMPQGEPPLSPAEVDILRRWVQQGASWPDDVRLELPLPWSLQPLKRPTPPVAPETHPGLSPHNPIDAFIADRHAESNLHAAPAADRATLIRRLSLDLTGLPPSPSEVRSFLSDGRPDAFEQLVDRLLASPHFGERWGRHWLDLARYADSEGYLGDALRPHAWVYREWVIDAVNSDLPFDQFSVEQLAGDLLDSPTTAQQVATGFHRNTLRNTEAGVDLELYRTKEVVDRVNTTGMVWLGLTLGCAECHDHKNDPITQTEFYQLYAFFNNADEVGVPVTRDWEADQYEREFQTWLPGWQQLVDRTRAVSHPGLTEDQHESLQQALRPEQSKIDWESIQNFVQHESPEWKQLRSELEAYLKQRPAAPATKARAFRERRQHRRQTFVHLRGVYNRPGTEVSPATPGVLPPLTPRAESPDRLDLARWLFDPENPLTARVAVNRIWQHLFGQGLVATPNDFGRKGALPTHPELLDWLASEYRRQGWSRKAIIRLIVTSSTYRMSSAVNSVPDQEHVGNQLLWRQNSFRVSAEIVRDLHLAASGLLDHTIGRQGIRPPLPAFVTEVGRSVKWPVSEGRERYRRGMYIFFKRTVPYPMLMTFDAPDSLISCSRRERSNTPLQALTLMNDPVFHECAEYLGRRALRQFPETPADAIGAMFEHCLSRRPTSAERDRLLSAYTDLRELFESEAQQAEDAADRDGSERAMIALARIILNLDEFITRD